MKTREDYSAYIGRKINKWTILDFVSDSKTHKFKCKCDCGALKLVNVYNLLTGKSKDCGCGRKATLSTLKASSLVGKKFGKLLVIEELPERTKYKRLQYKCVCDCGREIIAHSLSLLSGHTASCGCLLSYYNMVIAKLLTDKNISHIAEYRVTIEGVSYRYDFYLPDYNLCIEYDGMQHYKPVRFYTSSDEEILAKFERTKKHDAIKTQYCQLNGIDLLRIPYWEKDNIEQIILEHLQRLNEKGEK